MAHAAETYVDDLDYLKSLLDKHDIPASACIKLIHIHFHLNEGEILAFREFSAPPHGQIPFLGPMTPDTATQWRRGPGGVPGVRRRICAAVVQRGLQHKFGLTIKSGAAEHGSWIELDYPEKRATFLLPGHVPLPQSDLVVQKTTKTQFYSPKNERSGTSHSHTEHYHPAGNHEPVVEGVTTKDGLFLTGIPLDPGSVFYSVVSAISTASLERLLLPRIENVFGSGPPLPRRLGLPGGVLPSAIATARYTDPAPEFYTFTDLFSASGTTLYRFAPDGQQDSATAKPLVTSDVLSGTGQLYAMTHGGVTTRLWSAVAPVLKGVERISPYANKADGGKDGLPTGDVGLEISADSSTPLYINGLYYLVGPTSVTIPTDATGTVTIVEASNDLNAAALTVAIPNDIVSFIIDPMNYAFDKMATLNSEGALRDASYPTQTTAGGIVGDPGYAPLISSSTSQEDLQVVASRITNLEDKPTHPEVVPATLYRASLRYKGILDDIAMAAGDLYQWLKPGVEAVIDIIKDAATDTWHFIAEIAGKVYRAVLDTVEAIFGALEWIFNVIKTAIEQLIEFVKFLFAWDDIQRTKDVLHNVAKLYLKRQVDGLGEFKTLFDSEIVEVEKALSDWAGLGDWTPLGDVASNPPSSSATNPANDQTASSMSFANHFGKTFSRLAVRESKATADVVQETIDGLLNAVSNEGQVLSEVYTKLQEVATNLASMSVAIGAPSISFFDLSSWIAAVSFTVVYKIADGDAPFPDNSNVNAIKSATRWEDLLALFGRAVDGTSQSKAEAITLPHDVQKLIHLAGHAAAGFTTFTGCFLVGFEAEAPSGDNPFSIPAAILGGVGSALVGAAEFLVLSCPIENTAVGAVAKATTAASIVSMIISAVPFRVSSRSPAVRDGRATSAIVDSILVIPGLFVTGWHFYERARSRPAPNGRRQSWAKSQI
ncbi:hypothetical protein DL770_005404 [Monosporascus sp. CRB-9-2]|nr:hypothetical protein DL770_005404 [Monosporascus sp. CRB-9-2]